MAKGWARYTTISVRSLAAWRLTLGALALYVVVRRWITLPLLYSETGAYPQAALGPITWQAGALRYIDGNAGLHVAFAVCFLIALAVLLGFQTRIVKWLLLPVVWSVQHRTPHLFTGGEVVLQLQCFYLAFLPVGEAWSLDAWRRARAGQRRDAPTSVVTPFYAVLLLQLSVIYLFNAWSKSGDSWREGTAVARSLGAVTLVSDLGGWVAEWPPALLRALTYQTLAIEWTLPLLIVCPWGRRWLHLAAAGLMVALHGGILLMMEVGIFSVAMMAHVPLLLHPRDERSRVQLPSARAKRFQALGAVAVGYVLIARLSSDLVLYPNRPRLWLPEPIATVTGGLGLWQPWMMFAPDPPSRDLVIVTDAVTRSGRHFDPWRRIVSDRAQPLTELPRSIVRSHAFTRYEDALTKVGVHSKLHPMFARWVLNQSLAGDPVERFDAWMLVTSTDVRALVSEAELDRRVGVQPLPISGALPVVALEAAGVWEPQRAIDGKIVPDGTHVFTPVSAAMSAGCPHLTLDLGRPHAVKSAFVQTDALDSFIIEGSADGTQFRAIGAVTVLPGRHHLGRVLELDGAGVRFVRIRPERSDAASHLLAELAVFDRAITLPKMPARTPGKDFISARKRPAVASILSASRHPRPDCPAEAVAQRK